MKMNVKSRKTILIILLNLALVGSYLYIFSYVSGNVSKIEQEVKQLDAKYKDLSKRDEKREQIEKEINNNGIELNRLSTLLPPEIRQEDVIVSFNNLKNSSGIQFINLSFSQVKAIAEATDKSKTGSEAPKTDAVKADTSKSNAKPKTNATNTTKNTNTSNTATKAKPVTDSKDKGMQDLTGIEAEVNSNFTASYEQLKQFMRDVDNYKNKITIQKLNLKSSEDLGISGSMTLKFYGFTDNANKLQDLNFELNRGKSNPLVP